MAASTALNGSRTSSRISKETRERILKAAARLAYRPNATARALANRRMRTLGLAAVIDGGELNNYFLEVFNGVLEAATRHEQNTTVFALHDWGADTARLHGLCDGRIDGLILLAPTISRPMTRLLPAHTPFVSLHANIALPGVINIESDEEKGAREMVRHLVRCGHRRIMHVAGPTRQLGAERRFRGYRRALAAARLPYERDLLVKAGYTVAEGRAGVRDWLRGHAGRPVPDAIFCANDGCAIGCIQALAEAGLRVPDDISVAGFDDTLAARTTVPQLTTVRQPLREMGARAVEVLLARIAQLEGAGGKAPDSPIVFPVALVDRASVSAPPRVLRLVPASR